MRPALLRLLKRPSAAPILDALSSGRIGIEQLVSSPRCLGCHTRRIRQQSASLDAEPKGVRNKERPVRRRQVSENRASSFYVYDMQPSRSQSPVPRDRSEPPPPSDTGDAGKDSRPFLLQPEQLEFESDIGHTEGIGTRLVDDSTHRHDLRLWEELLRYRQRSHGDEGTLDILRGLVTRTDAVYLPVSGEKAEFFWQSFIDPSLNNEAMLEELTDYARRLWDRRRERWPRLYECVVGGFMEQGMTGHAVKWHKKLKYPHLSGPHDILQILDPALVGSNRLPVSLSEGRRRPLSRNIAGFAAICKDVLQHPPSDCHLGEHDLYRPIISTLLQHGHAEDALSMSESLIKYGQCPQSIDDLYPLLDYANKCGLWSDFQQLKAYARENLLVQSDISEPPADAAESLPGTKIGALPAFHHLEKKPFKDEFGARLFATAAVSFDTVLSGLKMFSVPAIGPLSLREIAVRSHGGRDLQQKLNKLQKAKVSIGNSVYARLLGRLASEKRDILLYDLVRSDQHPDMFEDSAAQESLLVSNYIAREWHQYNLALAALVESLGDGPELSNIHFRKHIAAREMGPASKVVDNMRLRQENLTQDSITFMVKRILSLRQRARSVTPQPSRAHITEVTFVIQILRRIVPTGQYVAAELWVELLKRLGMTRQFESLRSCCLWLARHYYAQVDHPRGSWASSSPGKPAARIPSSRDSADRMIQSILDHRMQAAIVAWSFKIFLPPDWKDTHRCVHVDGHRLSPWTRGLLLLRELEKEGVPLDVSAIRRSCQMRLIVLYGHGHASRRRINNLLRLGNHYTLPQVLADIDRAWGAPLFDPVSDPSLLLSPTKLEPTPGRRRRKAKRALSREHGLSHPPVEPSLD